MEEQVGGLSRSKPVRKFNEHYVMKPLVMDHRGVREIHFYETVFHQQQTLSKQQTQSKQQHQKSQQNQQQAKNSIAAHRIYKGSNNNTWFHWIDTFAMATALVLQDPVVLEYEERLNLSLKRTKRNIELIRRLSQLIPSYYGVVGQTSTSHLTAEAHILLQNILCNYTAPCVMDLKMGQETYVCYMLMCSLFQANLCLN